jgi:hypothetical protein
MSEPTVWQAILADPVTPFDRATLRLVVRDQQRWSRRWLYPWVRLLSRFLVGLIRVGKALVPVRWSAHGLMDRLCVWFLRRFVSPDAGALLIRHFVVETNLLNFVVANSGVVGLSEVELRPRTLRDLGNRAVITHDLNVYSVLIALGVSWRGAPPRPGELDFDALRVTPIDPEPGRRRWLALDIQTALCLMNIPFALCLTPDEYRRAVHSLRLDESLMAVLAQLTGDATFLRWRPQGVVLRVDSGIDVPKAVYEHAVWCEYAHARLERLRERVLHAATADTGVGRTRAVDESDPHVTGRSRKALRDLTV